MFGWLQQNKKELATIKRDNSAQKNKTDRSRLLQDELDRQAQPVQPPQASKYVYCSSKTDEGYRLCFQKTGDGWVLIDKTVVKSQAATSLNNSMSGETDSKSFKVDKYQVAPGVSKNCPCCDAETFFKCDCGSYSCIRDKARAHTCPDCQSFVDRFSYSNDISLSKNKNRYASSRIGSRSNKKLPKRVDKKQMASPIKRLLLK